LLLNLNYSWSLPCGFGELLFIDEAFIKTDFDVF